MATLQPSAVIYDKQASLVYLVLLILSKSMLTALTQQCRIRVQKTSKFNLKQIVQEWKP
jgi:hypothetical protein